MLAIRMQRTGRKGSASFRIIVQDSRFSPSSGRVVARLGHFNPHTKKTTIDKDKAVEFIKNGAQPSPRVVRLLTAEKVKLPDWVASIDNSKKSKVKNTNKLRRNRPAEEKTPEPPVVEETPATEEALDEEPSTEKAPDVAEKPVDEVKKSEKPEAEDKPEEAEPKEETPEEPVAEKSEEPGVEGKDNKPSTKKEPQPKEAEAAK